jgi:hypothetical protein
MGHTAHAAGHKKGHKGHKVAGHKHGGHVGGHKAKHKAGHFARGGKMTPSSPLSGADTKPLDFEHDTIPAHDSFGKGKDSSR